MHYYPKTSDEIIVNDSGEKLRGILHSADSSDLVIVVHGFASSSVFEPILDICKALQSTGVNAFRFDWSGHGRSEGRAEDASFIKRASDLNSVVSYFHDKGYHIKSVVGHSAGATAAAIYGASDRRIESVILIAPRLNLAYSIIVQSINESGKSLSQLIEAPDTVYPFAVRISGQKESKTHYFSKTYLEEFRDLDIYSSLKSIEAPIAIFVGTEDRNVREEEVKLACKIKKSISLVYLEGAGHTFWRKDQRTRLIFEILSWYKAHFNK
jgi:alpha-beta hydrolase superfamily lysophospholipase